MIYQDEKIIPLLMEIKKIVPMSLDLGYYVNGKLVRFKKTNLFDGKLSIHLPEMFVEMPEVIIKLKYPYTYHPQIIRSNMDSSVNFAFNLIKNLENYTGEEAADRFREILKQTSPCTVFYDSYINKIQEGLILSCFDFISFGVDESIYNFICIASLESKIFQGIFSCLARDMNEWKKAFKDVSMHIEKSNTNKNQED